MLYKRPSFSVSAVTLGSSAPRGTLCAEKGHSGRDSKGRCYSCGERIPDPNDINTWPLGIAEAIELEVVRDPRLDAITSDYLDEPHRLPRKLGRTECRIDGPASHLGTRDEMVNLEGGPAGDMAVPLSWLKPIAGSDTCLYEIPFGEDIHLYRPIGVESDSPRVFAYVGDAMTIDRPVIVE